MLLNHVVFLDHPSLDRCVFHSLDPEKCKCTECQVSNILRRERGLLTNSHSDVSLRRYDENPFCYHHYPLTNEVVFHFWFGHRCNQKLDFKKEGSYHMKREIIQLYSCHHKFCQVLYFSVGRDAAWVASGTEIDPYVQHILS